MLISSRKEGRRTIDTYACDVCGDTFERRNRTSYRQAKRHLCSIACISRGKKLSDEHKQKISTASTGNRNGFFGKTHSDAALALMSEKSLRANQSMSDEAKIARSRSHSLAQAGEKNGFFGRQHTDESRAKMSATRARLISEGKLRGGPRGRSGQYTSSKTAKVERFDSFFELLRMRILDLDPAVDEWTKVHGIVIEYQFAGSTHRYIPDFRVVRGTDITLEEIKGYEDPAKLTEKQNALAAYAKLHNCAAELFDAIDMERQAQQWFGKSLQFLRKEHKNDKA